jgi:uncharacterized protein DUF222/HNH endonuclease
VRNERTDDELLGAMDGAHVRAMAAERELSSLICEADRRDLWRGSGARDLAHFLCMRYDISTWKAHRWIRSAHALERLPRISEAFSSGSLGVDKVVELTRYATPETEDRLVRWAKTVSGATIRRRADLAARAATADLREAERDRYLSWSYTDDGRRLYLELCGPAAEGARIVRGIERELRRVPVRPNGGLHDAAARRFDAAVRIFSARNAADPDPERATIVVHAPAEVLLGLARTAASDIGWGRAAGCEIEGGPVLHPETARRLCCDARIQVVLEDRNGTPLRLGRTTREPSTAMMRLLRHRDRECRFPGCGRRGFLQAHHIEFWSRGGRTDLENLALLCFFHHKLLHEGGWSVKRATDGILLWFTPKGRYFSPGPAPPGGPGPPRGSDRPGRRQDRIDSASALARMAS